MSDSLRTARIEMRVPPGLKQRAEEAAQAEERTLSEWVEEAIRDRLRKHKRQQNV